jgi:hypothetical protein
LFLCSYPVEVKSRYSAELFSRPGWLLDAVHFAITKQGV